MLNVSMRTLQRWLNAGKFPHAKRCGCEKENWIIAEKDLKKESKDGKIS